MPEHQGATGRRTGIKQPGKKRTYRDPPHTHTLPFIGHTIAFILPYPKKEPSEDQLKQRAQEQPWAVVLEHISFTWRAFKKNFEAHATLKSNEIRTFGLHPGAGVFIPVQITTMCRESFTYNSAKCKGTSRETGPIINFSETPFLHLVRGTELMRGGVLYIPQDLPNSIYLRNPQCKHQ